MARKTRSYVDTSAFIAFLDRSDQFHPLFARLFSNPPELITSPLVIAEGHAWFLKRYDNYRAIQFLNLIEELTVLSIISLDGAELKRSTQLLRKFADQELTMADALGLVLMKRHKIKVCWSTDRHLGLTGVPLVVHHNA